MFKCLFDGGPAYLSKAFEMLSSIPGKQKLRSANSLKVVPEKYKLKTPTVFFSCNRSYPVELPF